MTIDLSNLPEHLLRFLRTQMAAGKYPSEQEYIAALLKREAQAASAEEAENLSDEELRRRVQKFQEDLYQQGLLLEIRPFPTEDEEDDFEPVEIEGPPISQTIIEDRR
jgi:Arc/MetJ-type ribon-helix-helix transcriptional regulator